MPVYKEDLKNELKETDDTRILKGINNLITNNKLPGIERIEKGGPWIYKGNGPETSKDTSELFSLKMTTAKGTKIVEGEDGKLYKIEELDL